MRSRDYNDFSFFVYLESETEIKYKGGSRHKNWCMAKVLGFLIRYFSNYYTLHRSGWAEVLCLLFTQRKGPSLLNFSKWTNQTRFISNIRVNYCLLLIFMNSFFYFPFGTILIVKLEIWFVMNCYWRV